MARVKENAQRIVILIGIVGIVFSSVAVSILYFIESKNQQTEQQTAQQQSQAQAEAAAKCAPGPIETKKVDPAPAIPQNQTSETLSEVKTEDSTVGTGTEVQSGDCILLFFHGTLATDGTAFEGGSNYAEGVPYQANTENFIPGFSQGLVGVKEGGERTIFIPAADAYADQVAGDIPANSDLIFTVKVIEVVPQ